jgi:hypothetical protein
MKGKKKFWVTQFAISQLADLVTTFIGFSVGLSEANPLLFGLPIWEIALVKLLVVILIAILVKNDKCSLLVCKVGTFLGYGVALWNLALSAFVCLVLKAVVCAPPIINMLF